MMSRHSDTENAEERLAFCAAVSAPLAAIAFLRHSSAEAVIHTMGPNYDVCEDVA
ncbi:MAG: hypothetical protein R3E82_21130 [Pseudomonadales bacterium]